MAEEVAEGQNEAPHYSVDGFSSEIERAEFFEYYLKDYSPGISLPSRISICRSIMLYRIRMLCLSPIATGLMELVFGL